MQNCTRSPPELLENNARQRYISISLKQCIPAAFSQGRFHKLDFEITEKPQISTLNTANWKAVFASDDVRLWNTSDSCSHRALTKSNVEMLKVLAVFLNTAWNLSLTWSITNHLHSIRLWKRNLNKHKSQEPLKAIILKKFTCDRNRTTSTGWESLSHPGQRDSFHPNSGLWK